MYNITKVLKLKPRRNFTHALSSLLTSNTGLFLHTPLLGSGQTRRCHSSRNDSSSSFSTSNPPTTLLEEPPQQESAVHRGTAFENRSLRILHQHLSMDLRRVGGKSDGGIDLQGWWWVPFSPQHTTSTSMQCPTRKGDSDGIISPLPTPHIPDERRRIRVFAQCKMEKKKIGPKYIREMEGVLTRHFHRDDPSQTESQSHEDPIVGLFISSSPFTKSALLRAYSSPIPFMLLHLPPLAPHRLGETVSVGRGIDEEEDIQETSRSELGSIVCNSTLLGRDGILQGEIEPRWERSPDGVGEGRPGLWYRGKRVISWRPEEGHYSHS
ncbi:hypothetical protein QCA50_013835 [Cerrena zonata]|uniref:Restriction endonuclease type IV Mrr domain-containing protein n=1 Tax=Cerrena zonata TaxID=2478898 RepID=A0AAW0FV22_9APHY